MRTRAWAWCLAFDALLLTLTPMVGMSGVLGLQPMRVARADALWICALLLIGISFVLWNWPDRTRSRRSRDAQQRSTRGKIVTPVDLSA